MSTPSASPVTIPMPSKPRHKRREDDAEHVCLFCLRPMSPKAVSKSWWVEMTTCRQLVRNGANLSGTEFESQGCFPVGSECIKEIPLEFRKRMAPEPGAQ